MRLLLDANVLLWSLFDRGRLPKAVLALIEDEENELFVSFASVWELSAKLVKGRLPVPHRSIRPILTQMERIGMVLLPIELEDVLTTEKLEHHHSDPFDRILIAQAIRRTLTILTSDRDIPLYPVPVIWR